MNIKLIETKIFELIEDLEKEAMNYVMNETLDKKSTNLGVKPMVSAKQILLNALDSIKMVEKIAREEEARGATK